MAADEPNARSVASLDIAMQNLSVDPPQNRCHLLRIPGEMRNKIYEYALIPNNKGIFNIDLDAEVSSNYEVVARNLLNLKAEFRKVSALPVTCRKIQKETQKLLYSLNSLRIRADIYRFYQTVTPTSAAYWNMMPTLERLSQQSWVERPWRDAMILSLGCISTDRYEEVAYMWFRLAFFLREVRRLFPLVEVETEIEIYGRSLGLYRFGLTSPEALKADFRKRAKPAHGREGSLTEAQLSLAEGTIHHLVGVFERESGRIEVW